MNDFIQILKTFLLKNEVFLKYLSIATGAVFAAAVLFVLLKKRTSKTPAESVPEEKIPETDDKAESLQVSAKTEGIPQKSEPQTISPNLEAPAQAEEMLPKPEKEEEKADEPPFEKLRKGLTKSRSGLLSKLKEIAAGGKMKEDLWEQFEEMLVLADTGVKAATEIRKRVEKRLGGEGLENYEKIKNALIKETAETLKKSSRNGNERGNSAKPGICMVVGVNGSGKTTTAGKLAGIEKSQNKKVMLAAADTFRAAATEQLERWAERTGSAFIKGNLGADPSGVAFDAVKAGEAQNCDTVIIDTAGRLHTKTNLMEELSKIKRVIGKARAGAPDEVLLVLDATTGQNAVRQTEMFDSAVGVTGIVLTKIDGTAKGGVLMAIAEEFEIPVIYVGTGEGTGDLAGFDSEHFASSLFDERD